MPDEDPKLPVDATVSNEEIEASDFTELDNDAAEVDPAFYRNGGVSLSESELAALGDLHGRSVLVLGVGNGEDVLSLINLGAAVTVVDRQPDLAAAYDLAEAAGLEATWYDDAPGGPSDEIRTGAYDVVYSGFGALDWVDDLDDWASGVADCLKTGGTLVAYDEHPFAYVFAEDAGRLVVQNSYFGSEESNDTAGADVAQSETAEAGQDGGPEFSWMLGDLVSAIGANGLATISLLEFPESDRFETAMDRLDDVDFDERERIPAALLLVAVKL